MTASSDQDSDVLSYGEHEWKQLLEESKNQPVVVKFWAKWCHTCAKGDNFDKISQQYDGDEIKFAKIDVNRNRDIIKAAGIKALPFFRLYKDGAPVEGQFHRGRPLDSDIKAMAKSALN